MNSCRIYVVIGLVAVVYGYSTTNVTCPYGCICTHGKDVKCTGGGIQRIVPKLSRENTRKLTYWENQGTIALGYTNFSYIPDLVYLEIAVVADYYPHEHSLILNQQHQNVFSPLKKLLVLKIHAFWEFLQPMPELFAPLHMLEILDLSFTRCINYTSLRESLVGFKNNTRLRSMILKNTQTLHTQFNGGTFNLSYFLQPIRHCPLQKLDISYNALTSVYPGILTWAPKLTAIIAHNNMLYPLITSAFFFEVMMHPTLKKAVFDAQGYGITAPQPQKHIANDRAQLMSDANPNQCISDLNRSKNLCHLLEKPYCNNTYILLRDNHEAFCQLLLDIKPESFVGLPCKYIPKIQDFVHSGCANCMVFPSTGNLRRLSLYELNIYDQTRISGSFIGSHTCFHPNKLEYLNLAGIYPYGSQDLDLILQYPVLGFKSLKTLIANRCNIKSPYFNLTGTTPNLIELDLSKNKLTFKLKNDFFGSPTIEKFNIAYNQIQEVPQHTLSSMKSLKQLNLSNNLLTEFNINLSYLPNLKVINLDFNQIASFSPAMMTELDIHASKLTQGNLTIHLNQNRLLCTCIERPFINWLRERITNKITFADLDQYICTTEDSKRINVMKVDLASMDRECRTSAFYIGIGAGSGAVFMALCTGLVVIVYRRRWWIRYQCFVFTKMYKHRQQQQDEMEYEYDAFVSYNCHDELWVNEELQPKLENEFGLKLCLHERDFELGQNIMEQISASIENSRKTLLILSPNFLASTYCHWEMNLAQNKLLSTGQDVLLLAILSPMSKVKMSRILRDLLEKKTYVEWTEDIVGQQLFWDKLHQAIRSKRAEYDLEEQEEHRPLIHAV